MTVEPQEQEPRVESLHALMRDIGAIRRRLETDLTLTAAAIEQGHLGVADDLLADSLGAVGDFGVRGLSRLEEPRPWPVPVVFVPGPARTGRRLRELAVAASIALVALVLQAAPATQNQRVTALAPPADLVVVPVVKVDLAQTFYDLGKLQLPDARPEPVQIKLVSDQLDKQIQDLSDTQVIDPADAATALAALKQERTILKDNNKDNALQALIVRNSSAITLLESTLEALTKDLAPTAGAPSLGESVTDLTTAVLGGDR